MNVLELFKTVTDEAHAARVARDGGLLGRIALGVQSSVRLALDPSDTNQVFFLSHAVDSEEGELNVIRERMLADAEGAKLLAEFPSIDSQLIARANLTALPETTLGGAYVRFLEANGLDPDQLQRPPGLPDDHAFILQRIRQTHDLWHVLIGLTTSVPDEIAAQAFTLGQLNRRFSWLIVVFGCLCYGLKYPETIPKARHYYGMGRRAPFLLSVRWERLWEEPLNLVRARFSLSAAAS